VELRLVKKEDIKRSWCSWRSFSSGCLDCYRTMGVYGRTDGRMDGRIRNSTDIFDDFAAALRGLAIYDMATVYSY